MGYYVGADLGTSALKLLLVNSNGEILNSVTKKYELYFPKNGWSEQNPNDWWNAFCEGFLELIKNFNTNEIKGIGIGGQMHGLVALDENDKVLRPAILWNDGRTDKETEYLNTVIGKKKLLEYTANIAFAGFTAPKILWMKNNEPENFNKIHKIMLPKDYINYRLTGVHCTDYSDASGTLLLDVKNKRWSKEMLQICSLSEKQLPRLFESYEVVGELLPDVAQKLNLPQDIRVVAGAGDNAAAAIGTATVKNSSCNISLGTSGTVFIAADDFSYDSFGGIHSFAHASGGYHLMGCILSAASCNKWFCEEILGTEKFSAEQQEITDDKLGDNDVFFLPYLMGERSPINNTDARGTFIGLSLATKRQDMVQSVLEGVAFAIRDCLEVAEKSGVHIKSSTLCGGGAKSPLWQKIIANTLNITVNIPFAEEGPGYGAAILAMVGTGRFKDVNAAAESFIKYKSTVTPDPEIPKRYEKKYQKFKKIYPTLKNLFKELK